MIMAYLSLRSKPNLTYSALLKISYCCLFVTPPLPVPSPDEKGGGKHHQKIQENLKSWFFNQLEKISDNVIAILYILLLVNDQNLAR